MSTSEYFPVAVSNSKEPVAVAPSSKVTPDSVHNIGTAEAGTCKALRPNSNVRIALRPSRMTLPPWTCTVLLLDELGHSGTLRGLRNGSARQNCVLWLT